MRRGVSLKRIISIGMIIVIIKCICFYTQTIGVYSAKTISVCEDVLSMEVSAGLNIYLSHFQSDNLAQPKKSMNTENLKQQALWTYNEFIAGRHSVGSTDINMLVMPTHEPEKRYATKYAVLDSTGDEIPELHVLTGRELTIFSFDESGMFQIESISSKPTQHCLLKNGAYIYWYDTGRTCGNGYCYFELDALGNKINEITFYWIDSNENFICDEGDEYEFDSMLCTKGEWFAKTRAYLYTDKNGREQIRNQVEWIEYCDADCIEIDGRIFYQWMSEGYELTLYNEENKEIFSMICPPSLWFARVTEDVLEIGMRDDNWDRHIFFFDMKSMKVSEIFLNPVRFNDIYIAYKKDNRLIMEDIFNEGLLHVEIITFYR